MRQPHVWMLGDWGQVEFAPAVTYLRREVILDLLVSDAKDGGPQSDPDLILLVASRPGRFSASEVESLYRRAPLARPLRGDALELEQTRHEERALRLAPQQPQLDLGLGELSSGEVLHLPGSSRCSAVGAKGKFARDIPCLE